MKCQFQFGRIRRDERGLETLQSVMILAVSALVLLAMRMLWDPQFSGSGGLFAHVEKKLDVIFNGGDEGSGSGDPGSGGSGSGGSGSGGSGSGGSGSGGSGSGGSGSGGSGSGGSGSGGSGSGGSGSGDSRSGGSGSGGSGSGGSGSGGSGSGGSGSGGSGSGGSGSGGSGSGGSGSDGSGSGGSGSGDSGSGGSGSDGSGSDGSGSGGSGSGGSGSGGSGSGDSGSGGSGSGGSGSGDSGSGGSGSGGSGSGDSGSGDSGSGGSGSGGSGSDDSDKDDGWEDYLDLAKSVAVEASKVYGQQIIDKAKEAAFKVADSDVRLLEAFGLSVKDFDIDSTAARQAVFQSAGVLVDAVTGVDDLLQGDAKVKALARAGKYQEAWTTTWSTPAKFIADTIFASRAVDLALRALPASAQIAIKSGVPKAIEKATSSVASALYEPVALRISDKLWELHDRGLVPQPRIPRR